MAPWPSAADSKISVASSNATRGGISISSDEAGEVGAIASIDESAGAAVVGYVAGPWPSE